MSAGTAQAHAIRVWAIGYLLKEIWRASLIKAIEGTYAGQTYLDPTVAGKIAAKVANPGGQMQTAKRTELRMLGSFAFMNVSNTTAIKSFAIKTLKI